MLEGVRVTDVKLQMHARLLRDVRCYVQAQANDSGPQLGPQLRVASMSSPSPPQQPLSSYLKQTSSPTGWPGQPDTGCKAEPDLQLQGWGLVTIIPVYCP